MIVLLGGTLWFLLQFLLVTAVGLRHGQLESHEGDVQNLQISAAFVRWAGILIAASTLLLPVMTAPDEPLVQCIVRVIAFFYACKTLDLAIAKDDKPPALLYTDKRLDNEKSWRGILRYAALLFSEMRYHSFDMAVVQKQRPAVADLHQSIIYPMIAMFPVAAVNYLMPLPELKCVFLLLLLQVSFESLHMLLHPTCQHPLFYKPFSATTASSFWATHWHAGASPFLQSLGYRPGKRLGGTWLGVLWTFHLTGIWHGWASAALVDSGHAAMLGVQVWAFFVLQGLLCITERLIWTDRQGGMLQRILVWSISIATAGQCFRTLQKHAVIPALSA